MMNYMSSIIAGAALAATGITGYGVLNRKATLLASSIWRGTIGSGGDNYAESDESKEDLKQIAEICGAMICFVRV